MIWGERLYRAKEKGKKNYYGWNQMSIYFHDGGGIGIFKCTFILELLFKENIFWMNSENRYYKEYF